MIGLVIIAKNIGFIILVGKYGLVAPVALLFYNFIRIVIKLRLFCISTLTFYDFC